MELLAPAGSFPAFEAALEGGADAVYVGAPGFNARALSRDFTYAEIGSMIEQAHGQGVKLYIAMNSLIKDSEIPEALKALSCFEQLEPDALIIQDLGLLYLARTWFADLPLHGSTLMSVHNSVAASALKKLGVERVVLARELTIDEIAEIHHRSRVEIEVFVHGAMCFSYSGLCLFSSLHGGKSSLRGQCVQPCRRHYSWKKSKKTGRGSREAQQSRYLFSMSDLCGVDVLPALREAGVRCVKIEGRMKTAKYVANTVAAYRMALDCMDKADDEQERVLREAHCLLDEAMGRKRSVGFLLSANPSEAISPKRSGNSGLLLGRVKGIGQRRARNGTSCYSIQFKLAAAVSEGDRLRLHDERTGERVSFTLHFLQIHGRRQKSGRPGQEVTIFLTGKLGELARSDFLGSLYKVDVGSRISGEASARRRSRKLSDRKVLPDIHRVKAILERLSWKSANVEIRRPLKKELGKKRRGYKRTGAGKGKELPWWVMVYSLADLKQRLPVRPFRIVVPLTRGNIKRLGQLGAKMKKFRGKIVWHLPPVIHEADLDWYRSQVSTLFFSGYIRFQLGHWSQFALLEMSQQKGRQRQPELFGYYSMNLMNSAALKLLRHLGFQGGIFSIETEAKNIDQSITHFKVAKKRARSGNEMKLGVYAYGRPPLFTARLVSDHYHFNKLFVSPKQEEFTLENRDGVTVARSTLPFSLLDRQQELADMGIDYLVLDLSGGLIRKEAAVVSTMLAGKGKQRFQVLSGNYQGTLV